MRAVRRSAEQDFKTMTANEILRQNAAAMLAYADGKPIQGWSSTEQAFFDMECNPSWDCSSTRYRPKPEPTTRPWSKPSDVPGPVCWIRDPGDPKWGEHLIAVIAIDKVSTVWGSTSYATFQNKEYSTDRINWKPCVTEDQP